MSNAFSPKRTVLSASIVAAIAGISPAEAQQRALEEVVVTATKRTQLAQDIPVSVQAMSGNAIRELGVSNFHEYVQYLPNVVWTGRGPGQAELYIRGAATEQSSITITSVQASAPSVALYQDEQPVSFAGRNLDIYAVDLERIEVLPGPQGTLFGSSSQTGTVRLITNKPRLGEFEGGFNSKFSVTHGGDDSTAVNGFLNVPITDSLAVRITAFTDRSGGWIDNVPGTYAGDIEVINRNQISPFAHICTGDPAVDGPISGGACGGVRATMETADNSTEIENNVNDLVYNGGRIGAFYAINEDWDVLVQHTEQSLDNDGVFEYDPNVSGEEGVVRFNPTTNEDEFGLTTWTVNGRLEWLDVVYTGGYLDRDVHYTQDYTGYTNGGGYQAYYICTGGYSSATQCFDPTKRYLGNTTDERLTNEFRFNTDPANRWRLTGGVYYNESESTSDGQFQYAGAVEAGFNQASAPGTITNPPNSPPNANNIVSTVDGVTDPFGRGPATTFVNNFTREETELAFFGHFEFDLTETITAEFGLRNYDLDYEFTGSTGSSFGCKGSPTRCDGQAFDNRVSQRLEALGAFNESGDVADLVPFFGPDGPGTNTRRIVDASANGSFFLEGLDSDGVINQSDTLFRGTLSWNATEDIMLFGTYSEGYRPQTSNRNAGTPAGNQTGVFENFLVPAIAKTDELENIEFGIKSEWLDRTLRFNATGYFSDITDLQMSRFDPANVAFLVFIENVGDAEANGVDADFTWLATENLTIDGAMSYVDNELTSINPQLEGVVVPEGSRLPHTPKFSGNIRGRYDFPVKWFNADAYVRAGVTYTGSSRALATCNAYFIEDVTTQIFGNRTSLNIVEEGGFCGTPLTGDDLASVTDPSFLGVDENGDTRFRAARYEQEDYALVNFAMGVRKSGWSAEFFVNNVFNERAQVFVNAADWTPSVTTNRPRELGLRIGYEF